MKKYLYYISFTCALFISTIFKANAQNFFKIGGGVTFSKDKKFIQSFTFDLNRTEEAKEKAGGFNFLYTKDAFYIVPTIDVNLGESITSSENNVLGQLIFGKKLLDRKDSLKTNYFKVYFEGSPVYNADKNFLEKKYYTQLKMVFSKIFSGYDLNKRYFPWIMAITINPLLNIGSHRSKTFSTTSTYSASGLNTELKLRLNAKDTAKKVTEIWTFKLAANGYRLYKEVNELYNKDYYGQLFASVDRAINSKISVSLAYKYGNDNPKYTTANVLEAGFKVKY